VYLRFYENRWTDASGDFITREMLSKCIDRELTPRLKGVPGVEYVAGLDLGLTRDRTARAIAHYDSATDSVTLDSLRVWQGSRGNAVEIAAVEEDLITISRDFFIPAVLADPWQLQGSIQRLQGSVLMTEFTFSAGNVRRLSETLFSLINAGQLRLYPDPELETELLGMEVKQTSYGWRIDHGTRGYSDRVMALGMACLAALEVGRTPKERIVYFNIETGQMGNEPGPRVSISPF
jgi:hypothetical protein